MEGGVLFDFGKETFARTTVTGFKQKHVKVQFGNLPLSKPMMATIPLMVVLGYWNDWMNSLYYITDEKLYSIQAILNTIITNIQFPTSSQSAAASAMDVSKLPSVSIRMAIAVIGVLPILCIYAFFQKYFVKGIVVGCVKG
ncbi:MAG: carbohydrate ABC transporter permease [Clostridiales bacterium]|nr:carbohydrate ABC transporter permease [Clostridiales bacterium]